MPCGCTSSLAIPSLPCGPAPMMSTSDSSRSSCPAPRQGRQPACWAHPSSMQPMQRQHTRRRARQTCRQRPTCTASHRVGALTASLHALNARLPSNAMNWALFYSVGPTEYTSLPRMSVLRGMRVRSLCPLRMPQLLKYTHALKVVCALQVFVHAAALGDACPVACRASTGQGDSTRPPCGGRACTSSREESRAGSVDGGQLQAPPIAGTSRARAQALRIPRCAGPAWRLQSCGASAAGSVACCSHTPVRAPAQAASATRTREAPARRSARLTPLRAQRWQPQGCRQPGFKSGQYGTACRDSLDRSSVSAGRARIRHRGAWGQGACSSARETSQGRVEAAVVATTARDNACGDTQHRKP